MRGQPESPPVLRGVGGAPDPFSANVDWAALEAEIDDLQEKIRRLGNVNLEPDGPRGAASGAMPRAFAFICWMASASSMYSVGIRCKMRRNWAKPWSRSKKRA